MAIEFEFEQLLGKIRFSIELLQSEINTNDVILQMSEKISHLELNCNNYQKQFDQKIKDESINMTDFLAKQIEEIKNIFIQQIDSLKQQHQDQIQELKNEINTLLQNTCSNIILNIELQMVKKWISDKEIKLKLIYRATDDGFQNLKIYEKCNDKSNIILLIQTSENRRFGFYADFEIKNYKDWLPQNPNNIFLFSLDLKQKYTPNEINCAHAFYSDISFIGVGEGNDIGFYDNSNSNQDSYVNCQSYGKNEGLTEFALNGGNQFFQTSEIEIFEVVGL